MWRDPTDLQREMKSMADCRFASNQWETALLCNDVSHWLGASLESALHQYYGQTQTTKLMGPTWGPSVSCRPQMGLMLAPMNLATRGSIKWMSNVLTTYMSDLGNNVPLRHFQQYVDDSFCPQDRAKGIILGLKESLLREGNNRRNICQ